MNKKFILPILLGIILFAIMFKPINYNKIEKREFKKEYNEEYYYNLAKKFYPYCEEIWHNDMIGGKEMSYKYAKCIKEKYNQVCWENMDGEILKTSEALCEQLPEYSNELDNIWCYQPTKCL